MCGPVIGVEIRLKFEFKKYFATAMNATTVVEFLLDWIILRLLLRTGIKKEC